MVRNLEEFCIFQTLWHVLNMFHFVQVMAVSLPPTQLGSNFTTTHLELNGDIREAIRAGVVNDVVYPGESVQELMTFVSPGQVNRGLGQ